MRISEILSKITKEYQIITIPNKLSLFDCAQIKDSDDSNISSKMKISIIGDLIDKNIEKVEIDSRKINANSAFFALKGLKSDGNNFIDLAIAKGAILIISNQKELILRKKEQFLDVNFIYVSEVHELLVKFLNVIYRKLPKNIFAVTGTNGKTSVAEITRQILGFLGKKAASIGTLGVICKDEIKEKLIENSLTTPDIVSFYRNLAILKESGIDDVILEASSIGLHQNRISGLQISSGAFTNFTQDHLDYHGSMAQYFASKMILFSELMNEKSSAILNSDIEEFGKIEEICKKRNQKIFDYGLNAKFLKIKEVIENNLSQKVIFEKNSRKFEFSLSFLGEFQIYNVLCSLALILSQNNLSDEELDQLLEKFILLNPALGRMQKVAILQNGAEIFIDFAHTPDALKNILQNAKKIAKNRVLILFGCGGNRDSKKRPIMANIANKLADFVIVTDDNPRCEDAQKIRSEILNICDMQKTIEIAGRKEAISKAISMLEEDDILILADAILDLDEENFKIQLLKKLEDELGDVEVVTEKFSYPLILVEAKKFHHEKMILIGDAACGVHPIAGQGFNLAIASINILSEIIEKNLQNGLDFSSQMAILEYEKKAKFNAKKMLIATDILNSLFETRSLSISIARDFGIGFVNKFSKLKKLFIKSAGGF